MSRVHNFVEDLAKANKSAKEIKTMVNEAFGPGSISQSQIYNILALIKAGKDASDKRGNNGQRKVRTQDFIKADGQVFNAGYGGLAGMPRHPHRRLRQILLFVSQ